MRVAWPVHAVDPVRSGFLPCPHAGDSSEYNALTPATRNQRRRVWICSDSEKRNHRINDDGCSDRRSLPAEAISIWPEADPPRGSIGDSGRTSPTTPSTGIHCAPASRPGGPESPVCPRQYEKSGGALNHDPSRGSSHRVCVGVRVWAWGNVNTGLGTRQLSY